MSPDCVEVAGLQVAQPLYDLVKNEIAPGTGVDPDSFWSALGEIAIKEATEKVLFHAANGRAGVYFRGIPRPPEIGPCSGAIPPSEAFLTQRFTTVPSSRTTS